jgi:hypothetical protein
MADAVTVNGAFRIMYKEIQSWRLSEGERQWIPARISRGLNPVGGGRGG